MNTLKGPKGFSLNSVSGLLVALKYVEFFACIGRSIKATVNCKENSIISIDFHQELLVIAVDVS